MKVSKKYMYDEVEFVVETKNNIKTIKIKGNKLKIVLDTKKDIVEITGKNGKGKLTTNELDIIRRLITFIYEQI